MKRLLGVLALVAGCGPSANPNATALRQAETATRALDRALGVSTAFVTAGNVDVGATPEIIAAALQNRVMSEAANCVSSAVNGAMVHADFGNGCALATAMMHAGGTVDCTVSPANPSGIDIVCQLALTVDASGDKLGGTLDIFTSDGSAFDYGAMLTLAGSTLNFPATQNGIAGGGATVSTMNATVDGAAVTLDAVHERFAGCYPDEGTATVGTLGVTFANDTPQSGNVMLSTGATASLPARKGCPP
jgi:hypothetical protein